jgi:hypothetical protein
MPGFQPYFIIGAKDLEGGSVKKITRKHVSDMTESAKLDMRKIDILARAGVETTIELCFKSGELIPISGFPRILTDGDPLICGSRSISHFSFSHLQLPNSTYLVRFSTCSVPYPSSLLMFSLY